MKDELVTMNKDIQGIKKTDKFLFKCDFIEAELNSDEYLFVDRLLQGIMKGEINPNSLYRCKRTGETFNLSKFSYLVRKKENDKPLLGENIKL